MPAINHNPAHDALDDFIPLDWDQDSWNLAKPVVLQIVRRVPELSRTRQICLASRLCLLLRLAASDGAATPDAGSVLTEDAISSLISATRLPHLSPRSIAAYRSDLRQLARANGTVPIYGVRPRSGPSSTHRDYWMRIATVKIPFHIAAVGCRVSGLRIDPAMWTGFGNEMTCGADVTTLIDLAKRGRDNDAALVAAGDVLATLRNFDDLDWRGQTSMPLTTAEVPAPRRPVSPTAAAAQARAKLKALQEGPSAPSIASIETLPPIGDEIALAINDYRSTQVAAEDWAELGPVVRHAIRAYAPPSRRWVQDQAGHVTSYVLWVDERRRRTPNAQPLAISDLLENGLVDQYITIATAQRPEASRATIRSVLRRVTRNLSGVQPDRIRHTPIQAPYTPAECAGFVRLARNQPTDDLRRSLSAVVSLGLGAGLDGSDQRNVTPDDVQEVRLPDGSDALLVTVTGERARTVVVRAAYAGLLREALTLHAKKRRGRATPLYGLSKARRNVVSAVTSKAVTATGSGVDINASRLRSTWLLACMNASVPLGVLLSAAGLKSARTLTDLLQFCPTPNSDAVQTALAAIADAEFGASS